jgi:hypothetical protein
MDHSLVSDLLNEIEDEDDTATGKRGLSLLRGPADADGSNADETARPVPGDMVKPKEGGDKLAELVASLSPEEKAKLRSLLDADGKAPPEA